MAKEDISLLLKRIAVENDKAAFSRFFRLYHSRLIRFALMFVYSMRDAEDVVSEVMIKLLRRRTKLIEIENFEGYLYQAIKNQALNLHKNRSNRHFVVLNDIPKDYLTGHYVTPLESVLEKDLRDLVVSIIEKLPTKRRMVYKMIKDDGLNIREVADLLDIAEKTVKKHLELAMKDLRKAILIYYAEKHEGGVPVIRLKQQLS